MTSIKAFFLALSVRAGWFFGEVLSRLVVAALALGVALLYFNGFGRVPF